MENSIRGIESLIFKSNFFKNPSKIYFKTIKNLKIIRNTKFLPKHRKVTFQLSWELFKHTVRTVTDQPSLQLEPTGSLVSLGLVGQFHSVTWFSQCDTIV